MYQSSLHRPPQPLIRCHESSSLLSRRDSTEVQHIASVHGAERDVEYAFDSACHDDEYSGSRSSESFEFEHQVPSDAKQSLLAASIPKLSPWTRRRRRRTTAPLFLKFWQSRSCKPNCDPSRAFHRRRQSLLSRILRWLAITFMLL